MNDNNLYGAMVSKLVGFERERDRETERDRERGEREERETAIN